MKFSFEPSNVYGVLMLTTDHFPPLSLRTQLSDCFLLNWWKLNLNNLMTFKSPNQYSVVNQCHLFLSRDFFERRLLLWTAAELSNLKVSNVGEPRTLYSLRHSSIMFRLMFGRAVDTLTLARNARTSPEMIDRFYAAPLQGEMNVGELQSKRRPRPWELSQGR